MINNVKLIGVFFLVLLVSNCSNRTVKNETDGCKIDYFEGKKVFKSNCSSCHQMVSSNITGNSQLNLDSFKIKYSEQELGSSFSLLGNSVEHSYINIDSCEIQLLMFFVNNHGKIVLP